MTNAIRLVAMLVGVGLALLALVYLVAGNAPQASQKGGPNQPQDNNAQLEQKIGIKELAEGCASSIGQGDFGEFKIDRRVIISNEDGQIPVPCKVSLGFGGELTLNNVQLRTRNLIITDGKPNGKSRVRLENSTLTGVERSGFFMRLSDAEDSLSMHRWTLDYPLSVWARVFGEVSGAQGGGRIDITASEIRSLDPKSEGIQLVTSSAGGVGNFVGLKLKTVEWNPDIAPNVQNALLVAGECRTERVEGFTGACDPGDARRKYRE